MKSVLNYLPDIIRENLQCDECDLNELRIRRDKPVFYISKGVEYILKNNDEVVFSDEKMLDNIFESICNYSRYAYDFSIKNGFITIEGGHRVGICGHAVVTDGKVRTIDNISSLNIRISHEIKGIADEVSEKIIGEYGIRNTLIISPPGYGKTTLLRDLIRIISCRGYNVTVIDERGEIGGSYRGNITKDLGDRTDVFDCMPKIWGINMALRTMRPDVIAVDEVGTKEDIDSLVNVYKSGVNLLATAHGDGEGDKNENHMIKELIKNNIFKCILTINKDRSIDVCI